MGGKLNTSAIEIAGFPITLPIAQRPDAQAATDPTMIRLQTVHLPTSPFWTFCRVPYQYLSTYRETARLRYTGWSAIYVSVGRLGPNFHFGKRPFLRLTSKFPIFLSRQLLGGSFSWGTEMFSRWKYFAIASLLSIAGVADAAEVSIDENKFGGHLNMILTTYQMCGLSMSAFGNIPQRHAAWVKTHTYLGKPIAADYALKNSLVNSARVADPAGFRGMCSKITTTQARTVVAAKNSLAELETAHKEAHR